LKRMISRIKFGEIGIGLSIVLFLVYAPVFPAGHIWITGRQAELVCATFRIPCVQNPSFQSTSGGYASATYLVFRLGTGPEPYYPMTVTLYLNGVPKYLVLLNSHTACLVVNGTYTSCDTD
jgi:hypothetical protein